jgi:hypothetical protein
MTRVNQFLATNHKQPHLVFEFAAQDMLGQVVHVIGVGYYGQRPLRRYGQQVPALTVSLSTQCQ